MRAEIALQNVMVGLGPTIQPAAKGARGKMDSRDKPEDDTVKVCSFAGLGRMLPTYRIGTPSGRSLPGK